MHSRGHVYGEKSPRFFPSSEGGLFLRIRRQTIRAGNIRGYVRRIDVYRRSILSRVLSATINHVIKPAPIIQRTSRSFATGRSNWGIILFLKRSRDPIGREGLGGPRGQIVIKYQTFAITAPHLPAHPLSFPPSSRRISNRPSVPTRARSIQDLSRDIWHHNRSPEMPRFDESNVRSSRATDEKRPKRPLLHSSSVTTVIVHQTSINERSLYQSEAGKKLRRRLSDRVRRSRHITHARVIRILLGRFSAARNDVDAIERARRSGNAGRFRRGIARNGSVSCIAAFLAFSY